MSQLGLCLGMPTRKDGKELLEVKLLSAIGHVNDLVGVPCFHAIAERREISCGVIRRSVALLHQRGMRF